MKNGILGVLAATVAVMFLAGCQPAQPVASNQQQARLLAAQNADLRKQLERQQAEMKVLEDKHTKELRRRDQELIRCRVRIDSLQQEVKKGVEERVKSITTPVLDENAKLRQQIVELKAQIEKLQAAPTKQGGL